MFTLLDELDMTDRTSCVFRSIRHKDEELLHVRLRLQDVEFHHHNIYDQEMAGKYERHPVVYVCEEDLLRSEDQCKWERDDPEWYDYTDLDGVSVPMEVLREMMEVEGAVEADWDRRGVEVSEKCWRVLEAWRQSVKV